MNNVMCSQQVLHLIYFDECILFQVAWMGRPHDVLGDQPCCNDMSSNFVEYFTTSRLLRTLTLLIQAKNNLCVRSPPGPILVH